MASKKLVIILLITALLLSATATYVTITTFSTAPTIEQSNREANIGVHVLPARKADVGVTVIPNEEGEK